MTRTSILPLLIVLFSALGAARADAALPALGLSASPDGYVDEITVAYGESFTLYVFMTGPDGQSLPFNLQSLDWALLGSCCGGSPAIWIDMSFSAAMGHVGDPALSVSSTADGCVDEDFLVLAAVTFNWLYQPNSSFHLGVVSLSAALDCDAEPWNLTGLPLLVVPTGITPAETATWSDVKSLYR